MEAKPLEPSFEQSQECFEQYRDWIETLDVERQLWAQGIKRDSRMSIVTEKYTTSTLYYETLITRGAGETYTLCDSITR
jgi:hypothetical protein